MTALSRLCSRYYDGAARWCMYVGVVIIVHKPQHKISKTNRNQVNADIVSISIVDGMDGAQLL